MEIVSKLAISLILTTLLCSCASSKKHRSKEESKIESKDNRELDPSTPNREDFVPLAPPVIIKGSPKVRK